MNQTIKIWNGVRLTKLVGNFLNPDPNSKAVLLGVIKMAYIALVLVLMLALKFILSQKRLAENFTKNFA